MAKRRGLITQIRPIMDSLIVEANFRIGANLYREVLAAARNYLYAGQPFAQDWHRRVWSCIRHCTMPTILFESCFIDNDADAIWLRDGGYKQVIEKIYSGVQEFSASSSTFISGENQEIKATSDTWLKKDWSKQASELDDTQKAFVPKGKSYLIKQFQESSLEINSGGNALVELGWGAGKWYVFVDHWQLPWTRTHKQSTILISPELSQVDWHDWSSPVSCYFNVGEVTLCQTRRIPTDSNHRQNVIELARRLDEVLDFSAS